MSDVQEPETDDTEPEDAGGDHETPADVMEETDETPDNDDEPAE